MAQYDTDKLFEDVKEYVAPCKYRDVNYGGCISGTVGGLCYYTDTVAFHDRHESAIWDLVYEDMKNAGETENIMEFIASWNGSENVGSMEQLKNLLCWYAVEHVVSQLSQELEEAGISLDSIENEDATHAEILAKAGKEEENE